ncbi:MAG: IS1380 family transposase [Chloroflexi bacterium]|nr:IS1380 family transposase [Chloroflexota bacterium]
MGDGDKTPFKLNFDSKVRLEFRGATITSDAGLLACRELDDALSLTDSANDYLKESRTGKNILHKLIPLLRQSIYSRLAGYDDTNDADRLSKDPAMRVVVGWKGPDRNAASTSEMGRFETELLTQQDNLKGLEQLNVEWVKRGVAKTVHRRIILDIDSSESQVHGKQEEAAYNGHFGCMCFHPLFCFNQFGDCEGGVLRPGNVHSADGWEEFIEPIVERYLKMAVRLLFRADAAFAKPELYEYMESKSIGYVIRLPANEVLQREISHLLVRPTEWPSRKPIVSYHDFAYQAQSWNVPRRVVAKVEWHQGELFPRVGFIVTNLSYPPKGITRFYNGRGTAEQWIKEGKYALNWTRLSCHKFVANQVRLSLFILAYNLGNLFRRLALPEAIKRWSLTSIQTRLIKTGGRLVRHARRLVFQLAEVMVSREMFGEMLERIGRLRFNPG